MGRCSDKIIRGASVRRTRQPRPDGLCYPPVMLYHCVYFWLKPELTAEQRADFRRGVETLTRIKAIEKAEVGVPAATKPRPVLDASYDVAIIVICKDVAAHNAYQVDPLHVGFVEKYKTFWTRLQIYDSV